MFPYKNLTGVFAYLLAFPENCDSYQKRGKVLVIFPPTTPPITNCWCSYHINFNIVIVFE